MTSFVFLYPQRRSSWRRDLIFVMLGTRLVEHPFCCSMCCQGLVECRWCLVCSLCCRCQFLMFLPLGSFRVFAWSCAHDVAVPILCRLAVIVSPLWCVRLGGVKYLRRPRPPRCPACIGSQGSWYRADRAFNQQVRTLHEFLDSDLGTDFQRLGEDTIEY